MSVATTLFPPANRQAALVAFLRTFWQTVVGTSVVSVFGAAGITASGLATLDWQILGWTVAAILLSAILAGAKSALNILANGLPGAYNDAAIATVPQAVVPTNDAASVADALAMQADAQAALAAPVAAPAVPPLV